jgi:hypothetical protein
MDFSGVSRMCSVVGIVGGEHITTIRLTGNPGDTFLLKFFFSLRQAGILNSG